MKCPRASCGKSVPDSAEYCAYCGERLRPQEPRSGTLWTVLSVWIALMFMLGAIGFVLQFANHAEQAALIADVASDTAALPCSTEACTADNSADGQEKFVAPTRESRPATRIPSPTTMSVAAFSATDTPSPVLAPASGVVPTLAPRQTAIILEKPLARSTNTTRPVMTPSATRLILFDGDPRNSDWLCDGGFRSDCDFAGCRQWERIVSGPYCRSFDYPAIKRGLYRVAIRGTGRVWAGATDYGQWRDMWALGKLELALPGDYTFCWPGWKEGGYGFEIPVQNIGYPASIERITLEYIGPTCD